MNDLITNGVEIKQRIVAEINNANQCIYLAMAYFTDRDIAASIIQAKNRGVLVDIILSSNSQNETVKLMLRGAGVNIHSFETGDARGIMHHKFCLIDTTIVINGSYNYSFNASNNNVENIHISKDQSLYDQFFSEFERLKYNIDHNISVNSVNTVVKVGDTSVEPKSNNVVDSFSNQLQNLVYSAIDIDTEKYKEAGYIKSKESQGNIDIYRTEYHNIKGKIRTYATDEGLGSKKNILKSNISNTYDRYREDLAIEKQEKISFEKDKLESEKKQTADKVMLLKEDISQLEIGNPEVGKRGLIQVSKELEKNKVELKSLEESFHIKNFWNLGTSLVVALLVLFTFYLSIFFASAMYKVFFESNIIRESLESGETPKLPQIVDANAISKIFAQEGFLFAVIATIFFLFPVLLSNLKLFGDKNKVVKIVLFWVGIVIFDVVVAAVVTINTNEIKSLLKGEEVVISAWQVVNHGEFWLMFVFGMIPLVITHFAIDFIAEAYRGSQRYIVDAEKDRKIQFLDREQIDLNSEKELIIKKIDDARAKIDFLNSDVVDLESKTKDSCTQIGDGYTDVQRKVTSIYDDYIARISSGKIFTDVIFDSVISAYKSGFIEHLPQYYSSEEVALRVKDIDQIKVLEN